MHLAEIIKKFSLCLLLVTCGLLIACSGGGSGGPEFRGSDECVGGCDDPDGPSGTESPATDDDDDDDNDDNSGPQSVDDFIAALSIPGEGTNAFQAPASDKKSTFYDLIKDLLAGTTAGHDDTLSEVGYELVSLTVGGEADVVLALTETGSGTGGGTYLFHQESDSDLILEVSHPLFDGNTLNEGAHLLQQLPARALFIAGTHRCANDDLSPCSGTTDVCGGTLRVSDVAHATDNLFHKAHQAAHDSDPLLKFISLHGFEAEADDPEAIVSNGTETTVGFLAYVNRFASEIEDALAGEEFVISCNGAGELDFGLCGTNNVQGRYTNGSSDACQENASGYSGRFIHLEQAGDLRQDATGWGIIQDALDTIF